MIEYYWDVCDKSINVEGKKKHVQFLTHNEFEKCIQTKHTIEEPDFFDVDAIFHEYITNHNKNFDLYPNKCHFKLFFDNEFYPHIQTDF